MTLPNGECKYYYENSGKNLDTLDVLEEAFFYSCDNSVLSVIKNADKIYTLVLDCDEICDAERYCEQIFCIGEYDRKSNRVEYKMSRLNVQKILYKNVQLICGF